MLLEFARVDGFRSLNNTDWIPIYEITLLTGGNDTGKSSFLEALGIFFNEKSSVKEQDFSRVSGKDINEITIEVCFKMSPDINHKVEESGQSLEDIDINGYVYIMKEIFRDGQINYKVKKRVCNDDRVEQVLNNPKFLKADTTIELCQEIGVDISDCKNQDQRLEAIKNWRNQQKLEEGWVTLPGLLKQFFPNVETFSSESALDPENEINKSLRSFFPDLLRESRYEEPIKEIQKEIQEDLNKEVKKFEPIIEKYLSELDSITINPTFNFESGLGRCGIEIRKTGGFEVDLTTCGAGLKRRMSLAAMEWGSKLLENRTSESSPLVLIFDEPDSHLDYNQQRKIFTIIRDLANMPGVQVIVATHSLNLIDRVPLQNINHFYLDELLTSKVERLLEVEATEERTLNIFMYGISQAMGLKNSILLHERCFLIVEGDTEMNSLPGLFYKIHGYQLQAAGICLVNGKGDNGVRLVAKHLLSSNRNVLFLLDEDAKHSTKSRVFTEEKLKDDGFDIDTQVHFVGNMEFEDAFSDETWVMLANKNWPKKDSDLWEKGDFENFRIDGDKFSKSIEAVFSREKEEAARKKDIGSIIAKDVEKDNIPDAIKDCFIEAINKAE